LKLNGDNVLAPELNLIDLKGGINGFFLDPGKEE
jgi:hypothetical protein